MAARSDPTTNAATTPLGLYDEDGNPLDDEDGDGDGNPLDDEDGNPLNEDDTPHVNDGTPLDNNNPLDDVDGNPPDANRLNNNDGKLPTNDGLTVRDEQYWMDWWYDILDGR